MKEGEKKRSYHEMSLEELRAKLQEIQLEKLSAVTAKNYALAANLRDMEKHLYDIIQEIEEKNLRNKFHTDLDKVTVLVLAYPQDVTEPVGKKKKPINYSHLAPLYDDLIQLVPEAIQVVVLVKSVEIGKQLMRKHENVHYVVMSELQSIWLRDYIGFPIGERIVKPVFFPHYYCHIPEVARRLNEQMKIVSSVLYMDMETIPLTWDGGNLVSDGKVAFISDRIVRENRHTKKEIEEMIVSRLHIKPVIIPELGDDCGHSDGYMAFADRETVLVAKYPAENVVDNKILDDIAEIVEQEGYKVERINEYPAFTSKFDIESAEGSFVNFLRLNGRIIMPVYDGLAHEEQEQQLSKYGEVYTLNCSNLAPYGGVLHCISWTC